MGWAGDGAGPLGLHKSNIIWQLHCNMYLKALKISATVKSPLPLEAGVYWEPGVGGCRAHLAGGRLGPGLAGLTGLCGPLRTRPPEPGSLRRQSWLREGQDTKARTLLAGVLGWGPEDKHTFHDSQARHCLPVPTLPEHSG